jgi:hypothetical protein
MGFGPLPLRPCFSGARARAPVVQSAASGATSLRVAAAAPSRIQPNGVVLVWQVTTNDAPRQRSITLEGPIGRYDLFRVVAVREGDVELDRPAREVAYLDTSGQPFRPRGGTRRARSGPARRARRRSRELCSPMQRTRAHRRRHLRAASISHSLRYQNTASTRADLDVECRIWRINYGECRPRSRR